jgi:DNA-binding NarL/FixJ family response regulator
MTTGRSPDLRRPAGNYIDCEITATLQEVSADRLACVDCVLIEPAGVDGTGLQALQALQARAPDVPVVVLTRIDDPETGLESLRRGAQDYLVKSRHRC